MKTESIPILKPLQFDYHHFGDLTEWKPFHTDFFSKFHINRIEDYKHHIRFPLLPHRKTVFDFLFLTNGTTVRTKGLDKFTISENTFFFLPAYQITTQEYMTPDTTGFYCHFDPEIFNAIFIQSRILNEFAFLQFLGNPIVKIDREVSESVLSILQRLEKEYIANQSEKVDIIDAYLIALFVELNRYAQSADKVTENSAFRVTQQYKNALTQFIYDKQSLSEYADLLCITPNHLNKCVKSATGKSAHDLMDEMILLEVKTLLKQTGLSISEIGFKIGRENPSDFSKFFKSKTGVTPSQYRTMD